MIVAQIASEGITVRQVATSFDGQGRFRVEGDSHKLRVFAEGFSQFGELGLVPAKLGTKHMKTSTIDLKHPLETFVAAREQMRLNLHLLNLDARQMWTELEAKILSLESKIGQEAENLSEATANAAIDLTGSVKDFVDSHVRNIKH